MGPAAELALVAAHLVGCTLSTMRPETRSILVAAPIAVTAAAAFVLAGAGDAPDEASERPTAGGAEPASGTDSAGAEAPAADGEPAIDIPNARVVEGLLVGGQPDPHHIDEAAEAGYETIVNLQSPLEAGVDELAARAEEVGVDYEIIPVAGAEGLTRENAEALDEALEEAGPDAVVHCASGNRVGALFALRAHYVNGAPAEEAIEKGYAAGMTGLADDVRAMLTAE